MMMMMMIIVIIIEKGNETKERPMSYQGHKTHTASHKLPLPPLMQYKFNYFSDHIGPLNSF